MVNCLADNFLLAAENLGYTKLVIAGGVSANSLLRRELSKRCEGKYQLFMPEKYLCGDNGAMVGAQAYYEYLAGHIAKTDLNAVATLPISENLF